MSAENQFIGIVGKIDGVVLRQHGVFDVHGGPDTVFALPLVEVAGGTDFRGDQRLEVFDDGLHVEQGTGAADFDFHVPDVFEHKAVDFQPFAFAVEIARGEAVANEDMSGFDRINRAVMHPAPAVDQQPAGRDLFAGVDETGLGVPLDIVMDFFAKVRRDFFDPFRFDDGGLAGVNLAGFDQRAGHDPGRGGLAFEQPRTGENKEFASARTPVTEQFLIPHADVGGNAAQQGFVN